VEPGTEVAGYRIESVLGYGGMGIVYEATQLSLQRTVALKILSPHFGNDPQFRERFRREGQLQAGIDHPHIVTVFEAGELNEGLFLAMRLVRGGTLKDMIVARELEGARTLRLLKPIADALDTAHEADLIHRDIKPQNILVGAREHAYLADFGLTKSSNQSGLTKTGQFVGTIDYISPEQILGKPTEAASDIYSLAAVLFECLAGVVPYPKPSDAAVLYAHISDPPPLVTDQRPELPSALDEVIARAMAKDPAERYGSASELIQEAERAFGKRVRAVITPPGPVETPEEIGLREPESRVPTRESRIRTAPPPDVPAPSAPSPPAPVTRAGAPSGSTVGPEPVAEPSTPPPAAAPLAATVLRSAADRPAGEPTVAARKPPAPAASQDSGRRGPALAGAVVLIGVLAVAGFAAGRTGRETPSAPASLSGSASNEDVRLNLPATWSRSDTLPELPDIEPEGAMAVGPAGGERSGLVIGRTSRTDAGLLPPRLLQQLDGRPPRAERVRLGRLEALRYPSLRTQSGDKDYDLILAPTTEGTVALACHAPAGALPEVRPGCAQVGRTVLLLRGRPVAVDPSREYASVLNEIVGRLQRERRAGRRRLAGARTEDGQVSVSAGLRDDYAAAATSLRETRTPPRAAGLRNDIVDALAAAGDGYDRLASAARSNDNTRFRDAGRAIRRAEASVERALRALTGAGYSVR